jgi:hypothetical protein
LVLEMYRPSTAKRRSRTGRTPGARATALALIGLLVGSGQFTSATQAANADAKATGAAKPKVVLVAQPERVITEVLVVDGGRVASQTAPLATRLPRIKITRILLLLVVG